MRDTVGGDCHQQSLNEEGRHPQRAGPVTDVHVVEGCAEHPSEDVAADDREPKPGNRQPQVHGGGCSSHEVRADDHSGDDQQAICRRRRVAGSAERLAPDCTTWITAIPGRIPIPVARRMACVTAADDGSTPGGGVGWITCSRESRKLTLGLVPF